MTGVKYSFLCFPLSLIEEAKANRAAALCSQKGEGNALLLATADEVSINEWMSDYFFCANGCVLKQVNGKLADL